MKNIHIIVLSVMVLLVTSCFKDKSNYDLTVSEVITVTGIDASYNKILLTESVAIVPTVSSTDNTAQFDYFWGIYQYLQVGSVAKMDTICKTKDLNYLVTKPAGVWKLVFGAKNKNTGYTVFTTSTLNVNTQFTKGWFVLKDDGNKTDMDFFSTPTSIVPTTKTENVFSFVNGGKKLDGKAKFLSFDDSYKSTVTGVDGYTRSWFITTDKDASIVNTNTMREIHDFNGSFYYPPSVKAPGTVFQGVNGHWIINDGLLYTLFNYNSHGFFGVNQTGFDVATSYHMSDYFMTCPYFKPILFDETSCSFCTTSGTATSISKVVNDPTNKMPTFNTNKKLLYMGLMSYYPYIGVAMLQDKTNTALKILSVIYPNNPSIFTIVNDTLTTTCKLYSATKYTVNLVDENILYFVVGSNQVWSRNLTNKNEQLQFTAPSGETISYIRHKFGVESGYLYNYVMVGTTNGTNYSVRMFTKSAGNLAATPAFTLTGTGKVADVFFLSPTVSNYNFPCSY